MHRNIDADVIIVGAGLSGLTAAYYLVKKEPFLNVMIFESSERIGGRILSTPFAQYVCGEQTELLELLEELHITVIRSRINQGGIVVRYQQINIANDKRNVLDFLTTVDKIQLTRFILKVEILCRNVREQTEPKWYEKLKIITLERFIQDTVSSEVVRLVIDFMIFLACGVRSSQVSALFYIFFCISTKGIIHQLLTEEKNLYELRLKNESISICEKLARRIGAYLISTKEKVLEVKCTEAFAEIKTNSGSYCCHNVIIAVPPEDILKVKFVPDLPPHKNESIRDVTSNIMTSFVATYRKEFWNDKGLSGEIYNFDRDHRGGPIDYCCNISQLKIPALHGLLFSGEVTSPRLPIHKEAVLRQLKEYFGTEALNPITYYERSWYKSSSRMFCWKEGNIEFVPNIDQVNKRIHWAGAETSGEWFGQMAGAVNSGMRTALEVLYDIRPAALTSDDFMFLRPARRTQRKPLETYNDPMYTFAVNWKNSIPVGILILLVLFGLKKYFL